MVKMFFIIITLLICVLNINSDSHENKTIIVIATIPSSNERDLDFLPIPSRLNGLVIIPGTYWCGSGNISREDEDLGLIDETDNCCRAHDKCPDSIPAGEYKHGLHNDGWYARSHCICDEDFYNCLKTADNPLSIATGTTYFTLLGPQCFKKFHPITKCANKLFGRCTKYEFAMNQPKTWQWFDNPIYKQ